MMIETYNITQLADKEGVNRMTISRRIKNNDPRYVPIAVRVNSRSKDGVSVVYALQEDFLLRAAKNLATDTLKE